MRIALWLCSLLASVLVLGGQTDAPSTCSQTRTDPYYLYFVNSAFRFYKESSAKGIMQGNEASKFTNNPISLYSLGDAVSIAALKIYSIEELAKADNTNAYLNLVRISFTDQSKVLEKSDQHNNVTLLVLEYLEQKEVSDVLLEKRIAYLKRCSNDFTCSTSGERQFVQNP